MLTIESAADAFPEFNFDLDQPLTAGGQKTVFFIIDPADQQSKALKIVEMGSQDSDEEEDAEQFEGALIRLQREVDLMREIDSPVIGKVVTNVDTRTVDGRRCLWFCEERYGPNLKSLVADAPITVQRTITLMDDVLAAIAVIDEKRRVHRDIKPENVLVDGDHFRLVDFGMALHMDLPRITGDTFTGTMIYSPLEQHLLEPRADVRTDIFGLGMVGYIALTGTNPFYRPAQDRTQYLTALKRGPTRDELDRRGVPDTITTFLLRCLSTYRHERYRSVAVARTAFDELAAGLTR